jgi:hypothetical protein
MVTGRSEICRGVGLCLSVGKCGEQDGVLTSLLNDIETSVGYIVVLELVALLECTNENGVVLGRYKGDCIQAEWGRHSTL